MRRDLVVTGGVLAGTVAALAIGAGWRKRSASASAFLPRRIPAGRARSSTALRLDSASDDPLDRYRRAAAI